MSVGVRKLTAYDLELFYQGLAGHPFLSLGDIYEFMKAEGEVSTAVGQSVYNQVYGAFVWAQLNQEANAFGMLPKTTWVRSGWRVKTDFATSADNLAISETATLPNAAYPSIAIVRASPKMQVETFEVSDVLEALAGVSVDDIWGSVAQVRAEIGVEFAKMLNRQILDKNTDAAGAGNRLESIDRIVGSYDELTNCADVNTVNIYNLDRDSGASWADSVVLHNNGTARDLTDSLIRQLLTETRKKGANTNVLLTGYDTYAKIQEIYTTFVRYNDLGEARVQFGLNGIETAAGAQVGFQVATLYGLPVIQSVDTPADTIQRLYALDTTDTEGYGLPRLAISTLRPVEHFETREFLLLNKFVIKGAYRFVGETVARGLAYQGKLRDLQ